MNLHPASILVIDDDPDVLFATARILKNAGHHISTGESGRQALELAQQILPDLVLLDAILPDINGVDVLRELKETETTCHIPVIIVSSLKIDSIDKSEGLETGADDYIARPIENRELLARVDAFLRRKAIEKKLHNHQNLLEELVDLRTRELTDEINKKEQARQLLRRQQRGISLNNRIATIFLTADTDNVYPEITALLLDTFSCDFGFMGYINKYGDLVCPYLSELTWPLSLPVTETTLYPKNHLTGLWADSLNSQAVLIENSPVPGFGFVPETVFSNAMAAPLVIEQQCIGLIGLANHKTGFNANDKNQFDMVCQFIAPVLSMFIQREKNKTQLKVHTKKLEEKNIALNVLLENRDEDKKKVSDQVLSNFDQLVFPYLDRIRTCRKDQVEIFSNIIEKNIMESLTPLERSVPDTYRIFTPMEIQIADLIKAGKTSKEISEMLHISARSVFFHRNNIRKKLNIQGTKTNLRSMLLSIHE